MTNEQILKNIEAVIKFNKETRQNVNEALSQAMIAIKNIDKKFKEEYERGCKAAWDLACDICCSTAFGGLSAKQLEIVFGLSNTSDVMDQYSYEKAKKAMSVYSTKKKEEPIVRGDIVVCEREFPDVILSYTGIFLKEDNGHYFILVSENKEDVDRHVLKTDLWNITKLDGHVNLD